KTVAIVLGAGVGLEALASSFSVYCQVQGRQDLEGKVRALAAALGFGFGIAALAAGASPVVVVFYKLVETMCNIAGMVLIARRAIAGNPFRFEIRNVLGMARASLDFTLMAIAAILYNKANLFFLQRYAGEEAVAQYSVTWQMVDGISCIVSNLLLKNVLFPLFSGLWTGDRGEFGRVAKSSASWLTAVSLPIMFVLAIEGDRIIGLIYGPGYADAIWMQKILVATILIGFLHNLAAYLMMSMKRERVLLMFYLVGLALNFVCCIGLIPEWPLMGTVLSITVTKAVVALLTVSFCQFHVRIIAAKPALQLGLAVLGGAVLYGALAPVAPRELAEAAAMMPAIGVAFHWMRGLTARKVRVL
ncbi:MAG: oligosaccharide flippase family protein, partial [Desulfobacteraceae bacterium]|nr:oligosaccharide flippase family protein [Desulfobacteraceae bacterium]